jgi:hypothetical protein
MLRPAFVQGQVSNLRRDTVRAIKIRMRKRFKARWEQYKERDGQQFKVIRQLHPPEIDEEVGRMWEIQFSDHTVIHAWPEEVERDVLFRSPVTHAHMTSWDEPLAHNSFTPADVRRRANG